MKYSLTQGGILVAVLGMVVATFGFTESCGVEIVDKMAPLIAAAPGFIMSWIGRARQPDGSMSGFKKPTR